MIVYWVVLISFCTSYYYALARRKKVQSVVIQVLVLVAKKIIAGEKHLVTKISSLANNF